jgi:hypothetical protein
MRMERVTYLQEDMPVALPALVLVKTMQAVFD